MKLRNQGPIRPAPSMEGDAGTLSAIIESWPGINAFTHWRLGSPGTVDGAEFHAGDDELGHIHLDGPAHILMNKRMSSLLRKKDLGRSPSWGAEWITQPVRSETEVQHAAWLFRLAYARLGGTPEDELLKRVATAGT